MYYCLSFRNERYKLIWGMPGYSDGYGMNALRFYDHPDYVNAVLDTVNDTERIHKRGGRPNLNDFQQLVIDEYVDMVQITPEQFEAGTGHKLLFDLQGMGKYLLLNTEGQAILTTCI